MIEIYLLDVISSALAFIGILLLFLEWKRSGYRIFKVLLIIYFLCTLVYTGLLFGEWSNILPLNEKMEDITGTFLPLIWLMIFYMLLERIKINKLKESEANWKITFFSIGNGIITIDADSCVSRMNPAAERLTGWSIDDARGKKIDELLHLSNPLLKNILLEEIVSSDNYVRFPEHTILISKNGATCPISGSASPILDSGMDQFRGKNGGMVISFRDISESYRIQEKLFKEEQQMKLVLEGAELGTWDLDLKNKRIIFNKRWADMLGYKENELNSLENAWEKLTHPDDLPMVISVWNDHIIGKTNRFHVEHRMRSRNGRWKWTLTSGKVIQWDENGNPGRAAGIHRDISLRKEAEEKLNFQARLLDVIEKAIIVTDSLGRITYWNPYAGTIYGWKTGEVEGKKILEVIKANLPKEEEDEIFQKISKGESYIREFETPNKDDTLITVLCTITPIHDVLKRMIGVVAVLTDITYRKQIQNELKLKNNEYVRINKELKRSLEKIKNINIQLEKAKERAEESDRLKTAFLANLSHEVRTPMNGIMGFAELLKNDDINPAAQKKYIDVIQQSGNRMLKLIEDLVDISKIEAGAVDVKPAKVNLGKLLENLSAFFKPQAIEKGLTLSYSNETAGETLITDQVKLEQILTNLIKNALKYTRKGKIHFGCDIKDEQFRFWVKDTGIGIDPENQRTIFERFRKANTEYLGSEEGSGLGLSISKAFIEKMGGKIWVESKPGKGSTFWFTIPVHEIRTP